MPSEKLEGLEDPSGALRCVVGVPPPGGGFRPVTLYWLSGNAAGKRCARLRAGSPVEKTATRLS
jgi:hypothetical protein